MITISRLQREALAPYLPVGMRYYDVPNPVDVAPLGHRAGPPGDFVFVGRISPEKRPDRAIEIATALGKPLKMAAKVDAQNAGDALYVPLNGNEGGAAFSAARDLIFKGVEQPSGYTEPLLHAWRLKKKAI